jgi:SAM-dependent methyltransferase
MNPAEYEVMARAEERHWWYRGLRDLLARCLAHADLSLPPEPRVLDAGCGTGANLGFLHDLLHPSYLGGFDLSEEALAYARRKGAGADVYSGDICDPPIRVDGLDLITSLDVICIPGADRALEGVRKLVAQLRPGGLFVVNLPAYDWLYSEHDVAVGTRERFTAGSVRSLLSNLDLEEVRLSYRLFLLFPGVVLTRFPAPGRRLPPAAEARSDLHDLPGDATNRFLERVLAVENRWIARGALLPFGSSVFAIGRKP